MKIKNLNKNIFVLFIVSFLVFSLPTSVFAITKPIVKAVLVKKINSSTPVRIKIPAMNIDAVVESNGLTKGGAMDVPKGHTNAGWYNLGTKPGDIGSSVISGHVGYWKNGDVSVFNDLTKLKKGDLVYIKNKGGAIITFIVRETKIYGDTQDATNVFTSSDGVAHLNLITCTGVYDKTTNSYASRFIVFTDKVS